MELQEILKKKNIYSDLEYLEHVISKVGKIDIDDIRIAKELEPRKKKRDLSEKQKYVIDKKEEQREASQQVKTYSKELGGHINMALIKNELLFNDLDMDRANISRAIYLATYIDYNNRQENLLVKHSTNNKINPLTRNEIRKLLGLGDRAFVNFLNSMKKNNLLYEVDSRFYLSVDYFNKGEVSYENKEFTRVFLDTTRLLFEGCTPRQHKQLSYVFQLVPFMNFELNIICSNPNEQDFYKLNKLGLSDICSLLGLSTEKAPMNKLENDLLKFKVAYKNRDYSLFKRVIVKGGNGKFDYFVINPYVIWGGKNIGKVKDTIQTCFFKD